MAAIYSNGGNRWKFLASILLKEMRYLVYIRYLCYRWMGVPESNANEMIVKASMDTGACYGAKKCAKAVFKDGKMVKGEGLATFEERMKEKIQNKTKCTNFLVVNKVKKLMLKG